MSKIMPHTGKRTKGGLVYLKEATLAKADLKIGDDVKQSPEPGKIVLEKSPPGDGNGEDQMPLRCLDCNNPYNRGIEVKKSAPFLLCSECGHKIPLGEGKPKEKE